MSQPGYLSAAVSTGTGSRSPTPSQFARDQEQFEAWMRAVGVILGGSQPAYAWYPEVAVFKPLREPVWPDSSSSSFDTDARFQAEFVETARARGETSASQDSESIQDDVVPVLRFLYKILNDLGDAKEMRTRQPVDGLINLAFLHKSREHPVIKVIAEADICLAQTDPHVELGSHGIADALVVCQLATGNLNQASKYYWQKNPIRGGSGAQFFPWSVILFASEYKSRTTIAGVNQLIVDFATAQHHRRALGLEDEVIPGITSNVNECTLYASAWVGGRIFVSELDKFTLNNGYHFVRLYVTLCKIASKCITAGNNVDASLERIRGRDVLDWRALPSRPSQSAKRARTEGGGDEGRDSGQGSGRSQGQTQSQGHALGGVERASVVDDEGVHEDLVCDELASENGTRRDSTDESSHTSSTSETLLDERLAGLALDDSKTRAASWVDSVKGQEKSWVAVEPTVTATGSATIRDGVESATATWGKSGLQGTEGCRIVNV